MLHRILTQFYFKGSDKSLLQFFLLEETMYFYDKQMPNTWSQRGNGWSIDNDVSITCYNKTEIPKYRCACEK